MNGETQRSKDPISRRTFLQRAVSSGASLLIPGAMQDGITGAIAPRGQAPGEPVDVAPDENAEDELPYHVFIPIIARQPAAHGPSKLGIHTVLPNSAVGFVQGVYEAGARVALVKGFNDLGYLRLVKQVSPETVTVGRCCVSTVDPQGDPADAAERIMSQHMTRWTFEKDVVDYWEVLNENDPATVEGHVWLAYFYNEAMAIAEENGYKLAIFSYSVGVPQWTEWAAIVETGVFARAQLGGHILALHEYNWPTMDYRWGEAMPGQPDYDDRGVLTGRYRYLYGDFLIPRGEIIPLAITECGLDPVLWVPGQPTNHWRERFVEEMMWYDNKLREDDYVIGAAMFTLGGAWGWESYDYEELLPDFGDYIVSLKDA